jgi:hypothetical protein
MQTTLRSITSDDVVAYFVWLPVMRSDFRNDAIERESEFVDPRVRNYWDEEGLTGIAWQKTLELDSLAWDIYLLFDQSITWEKDAPKPSFWMHQLRGVDKAPFLNEEEFQARLKMTLERK